MKKEVAAILQAAIDAANPFEAVARSINLEGETIKFGKNYYPFLNGGRLITIALGKAAPAMLRGAEYKLGELISNGVCITKHMDDALPDLPGINYIKGNHPVPGEGSIQAGKAIKTELTGLTAKDIVLVLLSGGGSALAVLPVNGVNLTDLQELTSTLLKSGATISEMNIVRKHLDMIKGGGLIRMAGPARLVALVLSDVVGSPLDVIASGPAYPDDSTFADALAVVRRAEISGPVPASILQYLERGILGMVPETIKTGDRYLDAAQNLVISSNVDSCRAAAEKASSFGFHAEIVTDRLTGEASEAGKYLAEVAKRTFSRPNPFVLIFGGETTVTVTGNGRGGRNQEVALASVTGMNELNNRLIITLATDGEDGPTDAAGAIVDGTTLNRSKAYGMDVKDYLANNDAYTYFNKIDDLLVTGPTGTNVNDISFIFGF